MVNMFDLPKIQNVILVNSPYAFISTLIELKCQSPPKSHVFQMTLFQGLKGAMPNTDNKQ